MLRTAGRILSRELHRAGARQQLGSRPVVALPLQRFFHASGFHPSGHAGQLDEFGIATGAEREELEWKSQGKRRFDLEPARGPFGTKEAPAVVESQYDVRIVGCSGGIGEAYKELGMLGVEADPVVDADVVVIQVVWNATVLTEDEHDITWFHLEKGKTHECPVCTQVFELKVIGVGGQPGHDEHH